MAHGMNRAPLVCMYVCLYTDDDNGEWLVKIRVKCRARKRIDRKVSEDRSVEGNDDSEGKRGKKELGRGRNGFGRILVLL